MIPAHSLDSIIHNLDETLGVKYVYRQSPGVVNGPGFGFGSGPSFGLTGPSFGRPSITPGSAFESHLFRPGLPPLQSSAQTVRVRLEQWSKLVGILFCPPTRKLGKDEIVPNLEYFNYRSGSFVDFFCAGYGTGWKSSPPDEGPRLVIKVDGAKWVFNVKEYNSLRDELERVSRWQYSGETDLLLLAVRKKPEEAAYLDFSTAISCNLEQMQTDGAFTSVGAFFEQIFRFGQTCNGSDRLKIFSDKMGVKKGIDFLEDGILSILPAAVSKLYRSAKHYAICDISI